MIITFMTPGLFASAIEFEILCIPRLNDYKYGREAGFLKKALPKFLAYRVRAVGDIPKLLPDLINKIVDQSANAMSGESSEQRAIWCFAVAQVVVDHWTSPTAYTLATRTAGPNNKDRRIIANTTGEAEALSAAIIMNDEALIHALIDQGISIWSLAALQLPFTWVVSSPLVVAIYYNRVEIIREMIANAELTVKSKEQRKQIKTLRGGICRAFEQRGNENINIELIKWFMAKVKPTDHESLRSWFKSALLDNKYAALETILDFSSPADYPLFRVAFLDRPGDRSTLIVQLLERGVFTAANINDEVAGNQGLLDIAVKHGSIDLVRIVLDAGAHPNGVSTEIGRRSYPIYKAIVYEKVDVVRLLFERGGDLGIEFRDGHTVGRSHRRHRESGTVRRRGLRKVEASNSLNASAGYS
jgi:hypothetical protein